MPVSPPRPKGPPLNALRAFEAAARLGSFAAAAEELSVTPGAISQHIKSVEAWSGLPLFRRRAQGVELTEAGQRVAPLLVQAFDGIGAATRAIRDLAPAATIAIAALPAVAQLWLYPRLSTIRANWPGLKLSIYALEAPPNLRRDLFDLSLFPLHPDECPGGQVLATDKIFPVAAPEVAARIQTPSELSEEVLLSDEVWAGDWTLWAEKHNVTLPDMSDMPRYSLYSLAVADAVAGAGVLMGHGMLLQDHLAAGRLVPVLSGKVPTGRALVLEAPSRPGPELAKLIDLLTGSIPRDV